MEVIVHDIAEYIQFICERHDAAEVQSFIHTYELLFRGQANKDYELLPGIGRGRGSAVRYSIFNHERDLIEMAKFKMPDVFRSEMTPIELLALLQHHGIPTRLLDITENALVALYFACNDSKNMDKDGEVIVFKHRNEEVNNYPVVNAIADSYRFARDTWCSLPLFYGAVKSQPYFLEQKNANEICNATDEAGGRWVAECCQEIHYIYAPIRSLRQQVQQGRYILFPNFITYEIGENGHFESRIDAIPKDHKDIDVRIIIPKEIKEKVLFDLSILGISKGSLFGDNIDTVCEEILDSFIKRVNH